MSSNATTPNISPSDTTSASVSRNHNNTASVMPFLAREFFDDMRNYRQGQYHQNLQENIVGGGYEENRSALYLFEEGSFIRSWRFAQKLESIEFKKFLVKMLSVPVPHWLRNTNECLELLVERCTDFPEKMQHHACGAAYPMVLSGATIQDVIQAPAYEQARACLGMGPLAELVWAMGYMTKLKEEGEAGAI